MLRSEHHERTLPNKASACLHAAVSIAVSEKSPKAFGPFWRDRRRSVQRSEKTRKTIEKQITDYKEYLLQLQEQKDQSADS